LLVGTNLLIACQRGVDAAPQYGENQVANHICQDIPKASCVKKQLCKPNGQLYVPKAGQGVEEVYDDYGNYEDGQIQPRDPTDYQDVEELPREEACALADEICCKEEEILPESQELPGPQNEGTQEFKHKCGRRNRPGIFKDIGSKASDPSYAHFTEWPHMCALYNCTESGSCTGKSDEPVSFLGGASLIAPGVILTAAHEVVDFAKEKLKVRCGDWDRESEREPRNHADRLIKKISLHPLFHKRRVFNNVALLYLQDDFILNHHIDTICLPQFINDREQFDHTDCYATGWGQEKFGEKYEGTALLKQAKLPIVNNTECEKRYQDHPLSNFGKKWKLNPSFLCAGGDIGYDACGGDGGGPLMCQDAYGKRDNANENTYIQVGITSWGKGCGARGLPGVYASVPEALCFIHWDLSCNAVEEPWFNEYFGQIQADFCHTESDDWIQIEYKKLESELKQIEKYLAGRITSKTEKKLKTRRKYTLQALERINNSEAECSYNLIQPRQST